MKSFLLIMELSLLMVLSACQPLNGREISVPHPGPGSGDEPTASEGTWVLTHARDRDGMTMVFVPAGAFIMGNDDPAPCPYSEPAHTVNLSSFWIDKVEVTNAMFTQFLNDQGNQTQDGTSWLEPGAGHRGVIYGYIDEADGLFIVQEGFENHPAIEVSWYGAAAYCSWVGGRLPTEAEWEYAARGPSSNQYPWGNAFDGTLVNFCDRRCPETWKDTRFDDGAQRWTQVGRYPAGASWCGALDLAGNVWEWVNDWWSEDYYARSPRDNPQGPSAGTLHIVRGGSWFDESWRMDATCRKGLQPSSARMHWVGFRCVIQLD